MKTIEVPPGANIDPEDLQHLAMVEGIHGYKAYLLITCRLTRYVWIFLTKGKEPPIHFLKLWFMQHGVGLNEDGTPKDQRCIARTDDGGELAGSEDY